jgi:hypothetical protein
MELEFKKISGVVFEGIDYKDAPDFCDAFVTECLYDGEPASEEVIEEINDDGSLKYELLLNYLY